MFRNTHLIRVCLFALCAISSVITVAQPSQEKVKRVQALAPLVEMNVMTKCFRLTEQQLRANFSGLFMDGFGKGGKLGSEWRPGNPSYDKARQILENAMRKEEAEQGKPLVQIDTGKIAPFFAENMTDDEIRILERMLKNEFGRTILRYTEAMVVRGFLQEFGKFGDISPEVQIQVDEINIEGKKLFTDSMLQVKDLERKYSDDVADFKKLTSRLNEEIGAKLGENLVSDSTSRILSISYDLYPQFIEIVKEYRKTNPPTN